jgi:NAD(P)H-dependent FMN reductase
VARIVGIAGSLRKASFNAALLRAAVELVPEGSTVEIASLAGVPLYDGDVESQGIPDAVATLKERVATAGGLLLVTPEYNNSIPGVFKNAIDWMSRPSKDARRVFGNKPVAMMGATTGLGGTRLAQTAWLPVFRTLGTRPWFEKTIYLASAAQAFDPDGKLVDERIKKLVTEFMAGFAAFVDS